MLSDWRIGLHDEGQGQVSTFEHLHPPVAAASAPIKHQLSLQLLRTEADVSRWFLSRLLPAEVARQLIGNLLGVGSLKVDPQVRVI